MQHIDPWENPRRSSRAVTDKDENMVRILITNDSRAKLKVVLHLELLEFHCRDEFSTDGTANAVMMIGSGICDAVGVFSIMDRSVCEQTISSLMATVAARTKVVSDERMDYSYSCVTDFLMEVMSKEKVCGNINDCVPDTCRFWNLCRRGERLHV